MRYDRFYTSWRDYIPYIAGVVVAVIALFGGWMFWQYVPGPLHEGVVTELRYTAQYVHMHDGGTTCYSRDKNGLCTFSVDNPDREHDHCVGGCYELKIDGCSKNRKGETKCRKEWVSVPSVTYEKCRSGQWWSKSSAECLPR